ncbi:E3 ubiquitin-protein ligase RNF126 isoform X3 [Belonocnema kinseyi]|uniref:E3 ubiquitin-protein ligase RNF126 isoform X3 n=1 Tax=Belonocnema kinseyi TaxID=2817044 RepID=UPI00143CC62B|nr:E3 ubiquitin-protein ligase RNF126 isoform X3 [Belonocnema kinseyi]
MAEAVVENPLLLQRFFCHECNSEVEHLLPNYTCPLCSGGFIEELENGGNDSSSGMDIGSEDADIDVDITGFNFPDQYHYDQDQDTVHTSGHMVSGSQSSAGAGGRGCRRRPYQPRSSMESRTFNPGLHGTRYHRNNVNRNNRSRQQDMPLTIDNLLHDFIFNLSGVGFGLPAQQGVGIPPILLMGNPGDYVWGRDGLDAIVTQLLNQMDCTGPPPLPKKQIEEIPTTAVSQIQVDSKLQCSVCWEDFQLSEPVKQLPCQHFYHAPCIIPWLELHGTCPICRQSLGEQNTAEANQDTVGPSLAALFRAANESSSSRSPSTSSTDSNSRNDSSNEI